MKESTKLFFSQYKEAVESSNNTQKDILIKYNVTSEYMPPQYISKEVINLV